jgi:hypothetical protein
MKLVLIAALALGMSAARLEETKIGAGVTLTEATPIAAIVKSPEDFAGKTVRVDGVATAVCQEMGCWMAVAESAKEGAPMVRLKVEHEGAIKFPVTAKGKRVSAQGVFTAIASHDAHGKEAASEHAKHDKHASPTYQITATGALIK